MLKSILYDVNFLKVSVSRLKQCLNQKKIKCSLKVYHRLCEKYVIKKNSIIYLEMKYVSNNLHNYFQAYFLYIFML
jgi:hypothetical protein